MQTANPTVDLSPGQILTCKYPKHGNRNILVKRVGTIEKYGCGPNGDYITVRLVDGSCRTLSVSRIIDPVNA